MIGNMWGNRKRSFMKRNEGKQEPKGVVWPKTRSGDRSSMATNRGILAAAAAAGPGAAEAAAEISKEKKWRFAYKKHMLDHVAQSLHSTDACLAMARAGLEAAQTSFQFLRDGHPEMSMKDAMEKLGDDIFETAELRGEQSAPGKLELTLSYGAPTLGKPYYRFEKQRKNEISGVKLREQLDKWVEYGTLEPDVADALKTLQMKQGEWLDLSDMYFVLLGAGSAMGPLMFLLSLGANVIAVARPRALRGILDKARASPGKLLFPVKKGVDWKGMLAEQDFDGLARVSGCDLLTQAPEIATWVCSVAPGKRLTIGNYTYLDGELHVKLALCADYCIRRLRAARPATGVAFLCTPTDIHVCTDASDRAARDNYGSGFGSLGLEKLANALLSQDEARKDARTAQ